MWMTVGRSPWKSGWRGGWTTCLCWSCSGWRWQHVWLVLAAERLRWMFAFSFCCFSFQSSPHISRFRSGTASISGGWSTLTSPPTAACVRTCCWASANRDSAAPVRAPVCQQEAVVYYTQNASVKWTLLKSIFLLQAVSTLFTINVPTRILNPAHGPLSNPKRRLV